MIDKISKLFKGESFSSYSVRAVVNGFSAVEKYEEKTRPSIVLDLSKKIKQRDVWNENKMTLARTLRLCINIIIIMCIVTAAGRRSRGTV